MVPNTYSLLWADYGPIMDAKALCKVLHYPTITALNTARTRGNLPFTPIAMERRRGVFALTNEIAQILDRAAEEKRLPAISQKQAPNPK